MQGNYNKFIYKYRAIYCTVGWTSFALSYLFLLIEFFNQHGPFLNLFNHLKSFETQTSLLVLLWFTVASKSKEASIKCIINRPIVRGALLIYIVFMWFLYSVLLQFNPQENNWFMSVTEMISIYLIPLAYIVDWLLTK